MDIAYVKIKGGFFEDERKLDFFIKAEKNNKAVKCPNLAKCATLPSLSADSTKLFRHSIVYGENGTGKSTISKAFEKYGESDDSDISISLFNENDEALTNENIFVFNEDYIDKNIKIDEDGLKCICMLGAQVDIDKKIKMITRAKKRVEDKIPVAEQKLESLRTDKDGLKRTYEEKLKGDNSWAGRERVITNAFREVKGDKPLKHNTQVNDSALSKITMYKNISERIEDLCLKFNAKKEVFINLCKEAKNELPLFNFIKKDILPYEEIKNILSKTIKQRVELTEREQKIVNIIVKDSKNYKSEKDNLINSKEARICPYCFRDIDNECRDSIIKYITDALSGDEYDGFLKDLDLLKSKLSQYKYSLDLTAYAVIFKELKEKIERINEERSTEIDGIIDKIENKRNSPYQLIPIAEESKFFENLNKLNEDLYKAIEELKEAIKNFNSAIKDIETKKDELLELNNKIAWLLIKETYEKFESCKENESRQSTYLTNLKKAEVIFNERIETLESKLKGYSVAKDLINKYLRYVFCDNERLQLEESGNYYTIKSKGITLERPKQLSLGERNILALCFFITQLNENLEVGKEFTRDSLIVIDDPISSIDNLNKVGIYSLFRLFVSEISNKSNSRILLLTHSLNAAFHFHRIFENNVKSNGEKVNFIIQELKDKELHDFKFKKRNEYSANITAIYDYVLSGKTSDMSLSIGNIMRRVLEAFSTFNYKLGIEEITSNDQILAEIDESLRSYFKNKMFRLVMHTLSHTEEAVKTGFGFFETISDDEKQSAAKDLLSFLYLLDKNHLIYHIKGDSHKESEVRANIESWIEEIKKYEPV